MKVIVYGMGKGYSDIFVNPIPMEKEALMSETDIVGFVDGNRSILGKEIIYNNQKFNICSINDFNKNEIEGILVTTKKYFEEIKNFLIQNGYNENKIFMIDNIVEQYLNKLYCIEKYSGKVGLEIGGSTELFFNIYNKCKVCDNVNFSLYTIWGKNDTDIFKYKNKILGKNLIAEATNMSLIGDNSYDFVLSSNNLEHIANPLKALKEFVRVLKSKGIVLILVPIKENIFDHDRKYTTYEHLLEDYYNDTGEDDLSHLPEIIEKHDYDMDVQCGGKEKFIMRAKKNVENRCLHHHVFEEGCLKKAFLFSGLKVISFGKVTDNWMIIGQK